MPWAEAVDLIDAASGDTTTELGAALAGWSYPASVPELMLVAAVVGKRAESVMPWATEPERPTDDEVAAVHAELLDEIRFN